MRHSSPSRTLLVMITLMSGDVLYLVFIGIRASRRKYRIQSRGDISAPVAALPLELGMVQITDVGGTVGHMRHLPVSRARPSPPAPQ